MPPERALSAWQPPWQPGEEAKRLKSSSALSCAGSIQGNAGDADHFFPALVLGDNESSEILYGFRLRLAAQADDLVSDFGCGKPLIYDGVDLLDNVGRRAGRRHNGLPGIR